MKKLTASLALLLALGLLAACGKTPASTTSGAVKTDAAVSASTSPKAPTAPPRAPIKAEADDFQWPAPAAESDFEFDAASGTLTKYLGQGGVLVIPEKIGGQTVSTLGSSLFEANASLTRVKIPAGVRVVDTNCFYFCENLLAVSLPDSLELIEPYAFFSCRALEKLSFPAALCYIGTNAFAFTDKLGQLTFLGETPLLGEGAFGFPKEAKPRVRVADEEKERFEAALGVPCTADGACNVIDRKAAEKDFEIDAASGALIAYHGAAHYLFLPEKVGATAIKSIAPKAFFGKRQLRRVKLPQGLEKIDSQGFLGAGLVDVEFSEGVKEIAAEAFMGCQLIRLHLPQSLARLGEKAFYGSLIKILHLPESLTEIAAEAFKNGQLTDLYLPASLKKIDAGAFEKNTHLTYLIFAGKTPCEIAPTAFSSCPIEDIDIAADGSRADAARFKSAFEKLGFAPDSFNVWRANLPDQGPYPESADLTFDENSGLITAYKGKAEAMSMYWHIWAPSNKEAPLPVTGLGPGVFENSPLKRFYSPRSDLFATIGARAFAGSQLEYIDLFDSVTTIGEGAFQDCKALKELKLPASLQSLGANAFAGSGLKKVVLPAAVTLAGPLGLPPEAIRFADDTSDEQLAKFAAQLDFPWYQNALRVSDKDNFVKMPDSYQPNPAKDFEFEPSLGAIRKYVGPPGVVVIPREIDGVAVTRIDFSAFSNLTLASVLQGKEKNETLREVVIPETVRVIEDSAFLECATLEKILCYGPLDRLGIRSFEKCVGLKEARFFNGVHEMGVYAFNLCESLEQVDFAGKLKSLPEGAFYGCGFSGELSLDYEDIGSIAFHKCPKITDLRIKPSVKSIGDGAFQDIAALKKVYFERPDAGILVAGGFQFSHTATDLKIVLPGNATPEQVAAFVSKMKENMFPNAEQMVVKE